MDGDAHADVFVSNFGPDSLYLARGDGSFARTPSSPGIDGWSAGAALFDAGRDGDQERTTQRDVGVDRNKA